MTTAITPRLKLTARQVQQLAPWFDRVHAAAAAGYPGMLVGQFSYTRDHEFYVNIAFLDHDKALIVKEAGRTEIPGTTHKRPASVP